MISIEKLRRLGCLSLSLIALSTSPALARTAPPAPTAADAPQAEAAQADAPQPNAAQDAAKRADEAAPADELVLETLMNALENGDYPAFVAPGDEAFKAITPEMFGKVHAQLAPALEAGYETSFFGEMKQRGYRVLLWKVALQNGDDDLLATLSVKDGVVGGFFLR